MKPAGKIKKSRKDEYLFGLLSSHKMNNTYLRVLVSEDEKTISLLVTGNPKNWKNILEDKYKTFRAVRRLDIGYPKLSVKFISPEQLVSTMGPLLNIKVPVEKVVISDMLESEGYLSIDFPVRYQKKLIAGVNKILGLSPQKKYEIIEKSLAESQEEDYD
jgi:hypothetical protein